MQGKLLAGSDFTIVFVGEMLAWLLGTMRLYVQIRNFLFLTLRSHNAMLVVTFVALSVIKLTAYGLCSCKSVGLWFPLNWLMPMMFRSQDFRY